MPTPVSDTANATHVRGSSFETGKLASGSGRAMRRLTVPRSVSKDGMHRLKVTVVDEYYNQATDEVTFSFSGDASGPTVTLLSPPDGSALSAGSGGTLIRADAGDSEGGIKYIEFYLDETLLTRKPREPFEFTYQIPEGEHTIRAVATDLAGNVAEDRVRVTVGQ
jgi:hypothetical protein